MGNGRGRVQHELEATFHFISDWSGLKEAETSLKTWLPVIPKSTKKSYRKTWDSHQQSFNDRPVPQSEESKSRSHQYHFYINLWYFWDQEPLPFACQVAKFESLPPSLMPKLAPVRTHIVYTHVLMLIRFPSHVGACVVPIRSIFICVLVWEFQTSLLLYAMQETQKEGHNGFAFLLYKNRTAMFTFFPLLCLPRSSGGMSMLNIKTEVNKWIYSIFSYVLKAF